LSFLPYDHVDRRITQCWDDTYGNSGNIQ